MVSPSGGTRLELQLDGCGPTPCASAGADGRLGLRSALWQLLASEALHALGVPTVRAGACSEAPSPRPTGLGPMALGIGPNSPFILYHVSERSFSALPAVTMPANRLFHRVMDPRVLANGQQPAGIGLTLPAFLTAKCIQCWHSERLELKSRAT